MQASEERQRKKQKRKDDEGQLAAKRQEMDKAKVSLIPSFDPRLDTPTLLDEAISASFELHH